MRFEKSRPQWKMLVFSDITSWTLLKQRPDGPGKLSTLPSPIWEFKPVTSGHSNSLPSCSCISGQYLCRALTAGRYTCTSYCLWSPWDSSLSLHSPFPFFFCAKGNPEVVFTGADTSHVLWEPAWQCWLLSLPCSLSLWHTSLAFWKGNNTQGSCFGFLKKKWD